MSVSGSSDGFLGRKSRVLEQYFVVLVFLAVAVAIAFIARIMGQLLSPSKPNKAKLSAYECGFDALCVPHEPFDVRYYLVAILFIIFDLETAFLFPWAVSLRKIGWLGFNAMMIFLFILIVGFVYEWRMGALEWE